MEEGVVQDSEAENLLSINGHHALTSVHSRLNKMRPVWIRSHERVDKSNSGKVSSAGSANGMDVGRRDGVHGP